MAILVEIFQYEIIIFAALSRARPHPGPLLRARAHTRGAKIADTRGLFDRSSSPILGRKKYPEKAGNR